MKKLLCLVMSCFLAAGIIPVFAENTEGLENAVLTVKSRIEIPQDYTEFSGNIYMSQNETESYRLNWSKPKNDGGSDTLNVVIDKYGNITEYEMSAVYDTYGMEKQLPKFDEGQIKQIGYDFFAKLNPSLTDEYLFDNIEFGGFDINNPESSVRIYRYVNGVKFCGDGAYVRINNVTGQISSMTVSVTYCNEIPLPENLISEDEAKAAFKKLSPMNAEYDTVDLNKAELVYRPSNRYLEIDAKTGGNFVYPMDMSSRGEYSGGASEALMAADSMKESFSEQELKNMELINSLLSVEEMRSIVEGIPELELTADMYSSCKYERYDKYSRIASEYRAVMSYSSSDSERRASITLDAETGELLSYSYGLDYIADFPKLSEAQALETAKSFAEKYLNDYASTYTDLEASDTIDEKNWRNSTYYTFYFERVENDYKYSEDWISVSIDKQQGKIAYFDKKWNRNMEFESPEGIILPDEAADIVLNNMGLELQYTSYNTDETNKNAALVYRLKDNIYVNVSARSGKIINDYGYEYTKETKSTASDIGGHYGEEKIAALLAYNIITLPDGETEFRPDEAITQAEMLKFTSALGRWGIPAPVEYKDMYLYARTNDIIDEDEIDENALCSREDGVKFIIRTIGYRDVAELSGIYDSGFIDRGEITDGMEGYVALARGFGIVCGDYNNNFAPQNVLTRADAAIMIYNYLY